MNQLFGLQHRGGQTPCEPTGLAMALFWSITATRCITPFTLIAAIIFKLFLKRLNS